MTYDEQPAAAAGSLLRVREWMTPAPLTVAPQTSVLNARRLLLAHGIRHLPVVVDGDRVVGMLSDRDVLLRDSHVAQALPAVRSDLLSGRYRPVDTVMASPVRAVRPDDTVRAAAECLQRWRISALPVSEWGRLVGIITSTDCLRALVHTLDEQDRLRRRDPRADFPDDPDWYKATPLPDDSQVPDRAPLPF